ncbi:MAG: phosphoglucosamine mutase [Pyrinomonadaceae bacterium]|nr:phosphoglucosamine mutase [Pyrinomonadaceae bacterium]
MQASGQELKPTKLFGTDGIRGVAGEFPLDSPTVRSIGRSLARLFAKPDGEQTRFVVGRDTRESGTAIEQALIEGARSGGAACETAGIITTPGVAFVTANDGYDAGVVISASHNPFQDNGIKIFLPTGKKLGEDFEKRIEADVHSDRNGEVNPPELEGQAVSHTPEELHSEYLDHLRAHFAGLDLAGMKIVTDCANGAASELAPELFSSLGADVTAIHFQPDGRNINENCGSLHLEGLRNAVGAHGADIGIAFDGDADRSLFVDEKGNLVDGDAVLWILACELARKGELKNRKVVATVMSNVGLEIALRGRGIELVRTSVGDKYVLDELLRSGSELGGEQSGHIIFPKLSLVGDGMLTALFVLSIMRSNRKRLSELIEGFDRYPQVLVNVRVREKRPFDEVSTIKLAADEVERELEGRGRLLLRYSGTENLARVMIEGQDQETIDRLAGRLADVIRTELA